MSYVCLVNDDNYHYYLIPVELRDDFEKWASDAYLPIDELEDYDDSKYDAFALVYPISKIAFKNDYYILDED